MLQDAFGRVRYRVGQVRKRCTGRVPYEALAQAQALLGATCWPLFVAMPRGDRIHALAVYRQLSSATQDRAVLAAALLHDVGKTGIGLGLAQRTLCVLLGCFAPSVLEMMGRRHRGWQRPFYGHLHHAALGAQACAQQGCDEAVVWLVAHHEDRVVPQGDPLWVQSLQALQRADDCS